MFRFRTACRRGKRPASAPHAPAEPPPPPPNDGQIRRRRLPVRPTGPPRSARSQGADSPRHGGPWLAGKGGNQRRVGQGAHLLCVRVMGLGGVWGEGRGERAPYPRDLDELDCQCLAHLCGQPVELRPHVLQPGFHCKARTGHARSRPRPQTQQQHGSGRSVSAWLWRWGRAHPAEVARATLLRWGARYVRGGGWGRRACAPSISNSLSLKSRAWAWTCSVDMPSNIWSGRVLNLTPPSIWSGDPTGVQSSADDMACSSGSSPSRVARALGAAALGRPSRRDPCPCLAPAPQALARVGAPAGVKRRIGPCSTKNCPLPARKQLGFAQRFFSGLSRTRSHTEPEAKRAALFQTTGVPVCPAVPSFVRARHHV